MLQTPLLLTASAAGPRMAPASFLVVLMGKKEMGRGLWGPPQCWVHSGCSHFKFKAFYMAAEWEAFQDLQEAGKESSIARSILMETEELANKHMWNVPLFVTTGGTVFPTNTRPFWRRTVATCHSGYGLCCPAKESIERAVPPPFPAPTFCSLSSIAALFSTVFSKILDL